MVDSKGMHGECERKKQSHIGIILRLIINSHILFPFNSPAWFCQHNEFNIEIGVNLGKTLLSVILKVLILNELTLHEIRHLRTFPFWKESH